MYLAYLKVHLHESDFFSCGFFEDNDAVCLKWQALGALKWNKMGFSTVERDLL